MKLLTDNEITDLAYEAKSQVDQLATRLQCATRSLELADERFADALVYAARSGSHHAANVIRLMQGQVALEKGEGDEEA